MLKLQSELQSGADVRFSEWKYFNASVNSICYYPPPPPAKVVDDEADEEDD